MRVAHARGAVEEAREGVPGVQIAGRTGIGPATEGNRSAWAGSPRADQADSGGRRPDRTRQPARRPLLTVRAGLGEAAEVLRAAGHQPNWAWGGGRAGAMGSGSVGTVHSYCTPFLRACHFARVT